MTEDPIEAKTISSLRHIYSCCQNCTCLIGRYYQPDCFSFFAFLLTDQIHCQFFVEKLWHNGVQWRSDGLYTAHSSNSFHTCISFFTLHSKCMAGINCIDQPKIWEKNSFKWQSSSKNAILFPLGEIHLYSLFSNKVSQGCNIPTFTTCFSFERGFGYFGHHASNACASLQ